MHAIDVGFGGDSETTQIFRIGEASCAVPGRGRRARGGPRRTVVCPGASSSQPAIELARGGLELTRPQAHLHAILDLILRHTGEGRRLYSRPTARGSSPATRSASRISRHARADRGGGAAALYRGELGRRRSRAQSRSGGGGLTREDLAAYRVAWRRPVRARYRGYEVVSNPPPSSGGILIAYGLALLERARRGAPGSAEAIASLAEVMREQTRARRRASRGPASRRSRAAAARATSRRAACARIDGALPAPPSTRRAGGTTHVSAVDADGNAGVALVVDRVRLGRDRPGHRHPPQQHARRVRPRRGRPGDAGRRLTSMMAPTVVVGDGGPRLVVGSAGLGSSARRDHAGDRRT